MIGLRLPDNEPIIIDATPSFSRSRVASDESKTMRCTPTMKVWIAQSCRLMHGLDGG